MFSISSKNNHNSSAQSAKKTPSAPTLIAMDMNILGNLFSEGITDIDGRVEGNVKAEQITIRPNGKIKGDLSAETVHVYGEVKGLIKAKSVHLYSTCRVEGIIMHESLSIEDGAFVDGKFKRSDKMLSDSLMDQTLEDSADSEETNGLKLLGNLRLVGQ